jgi:SAM-dependent methyltransferase
MDESKILAAWRRNADNWRATLSGQEIASRAVTNPAILSAIDGYLPASVLDVGCGEGWLLRQLRGRGSIIPTDPERGTPLDPTLVGFDGSEGLILAARLWGGAVYHDLPYAKATAKKLAALGRFELIVCNYSLFGKESVVTLLSNLRSCFHPGGRLLIQTVHESVFAGQTGWIAEDWHLMKQDYEGSYHWYLRDRAAWEQTFTAAGWQLADTQETQHPETGAAISFIFHLR